MGFNSVILVLNDALGVIEQNPEEFVKGVSMAIHQGVPQDISVGGCVPAASLISVDHADCHVLIAAGGNYGTVISKQYRGNAGHREREDKLKLLTRAAVELESELPQLRRKELRGDLCLWPGDKYPVPYSLDILYNFAKDYLSKHPKARVSAVHEEAVAKFGVCAYTHMRAVWILLKPPYGLGHQNV